MGNDSVLGVLAIATWMNLPLLMVEALQLLRYMKKPQKSLPLTCLVLWCFAADVSSSIIDCLSVYLYVVTHWGDQSYSLKSHWPGVFQLVCTGAVAFPVQTFLTLRYYILSRNIYITGLLVTVSLLSFGGALTIAALSSMHSSYSQRPLLNALSTIWLSSSIAADWGIAFGLVWELYKRKSRVKIERTHHMIHRLISNAIKTGAVVSSFVTTCFVLFLLFPQTNLPVAFGFLLPRVYSLTMLYSINNAGGLLKHYEQEIELRKEGELGARVEPGIFTTISISRVSQNHMITMSMDASTGNVSELTEDVKDVEVRIR
jgi:hypothetical protein